MAKVDYSFLFTGAMWEASNLQSMKYSFLSALPAYYTLNPFLGTAHALLFEPGTASLLTTDSDPSFIDQQDIVRFLLDSPGALSGYAGPQTVNAILVNAANTVTPSGVVNYRVSYGDVINANFSEDESGSGDLAIMNQNAYNSSDHSVTYTPNALNKFFGNAGDVFINSLDTAALTELKPGEYGFWLLLHELGHAIGGLDDFEQNDPFNSQQYSAMSYNPHMGVYASGLQLLDIAALQDTYGQRNYTTRAGDTEYALAKGLGFFGAEADDPFLYTIWDGSGVDTIDASAFNLSVKIDLRQGSFSSIGDYGLGQSKNNVAVAYYTVIENAIGTNDTTSGDLLIGNAWNNRLEGGAGNDRIYGDGVVFDKNTGFGAKASEDDQYRSYGVRDGIHGAADNLSGDDYLDGGAGDDQLYGGAGNDTILGGADNDTIYAGGGNDHIDGGDGTDTVVFTDYGSGLEIDLINGFVRSVDNPAEESTILNVEDIRLAEFSSIFTGSDFNDIATGAGGDDILIGNAGDDLLRGGGGFNRSSGGADNDTYVFNFARANGTLAGGGIVNKTRETDAWMYVNEEALSGSDTVKLENESLANLIFAAKGFDLVVFRENRYVGGTAKTLYHEGGLVIKNGLLNSPVEFIRIGNKTYGRQFFDTSHPLYDANHEDTLVLSSMTAERGAFLDGLIAQFETTGTPDYSAVGMDITGTAADEVIFGSAGADTLAGGAGRDGIYGGEKDDVIFGGDGNDDIAGESGNDTLHGDGGIDKIYGGKGVDVLDGGADNDTLYGEAGADTIEGGPICRGAHGAAMRVRQTTRPALMNRFTAAGGVHVVANDNNMRACRAVA